MADKIRSRNGKQCKQGPRRPRFRRLLNASAGRGARSSNSMRQKISYTESHYAKHSGGESSRPPVPVGTVYLTSSQFLPRSPPKSFVLFRLLLSYVFVVFGEVKRGDCSILERVLIARWCFRKIQRIATDHGTYIPAKTLATT